MELRCRLLLIEWVMVWTRLSPGLWWHRASCSCRIPAPYVIIFTVSIIIGKHFLGSASLCSWHALYLADVLQVNVVIMCGATWRAKMSWASAWTLFDWKNRTNSFNQYFSLRNHNRYCKFQEIYRDFWLFMQCSLNPLKFLLNIYCVFRNENKFLLT